MKNVAGPPALSVEGVSHRYGKRVALNDISLSVVPGSFSVLLGVNGAGKTTLFNLVTRLFSVRTGRIAICGHDLNTDPGAALAAMGVVFQTRALDASLTVAQNFVYAAALHGIGRRDALSHGKALLDRMDLGDRMDERVARLSGGQARRVEIARALLHRPRLLLCDEATVGLDVKSRADIVAEVHMLARDGGVGVLWTTHLIDEIEPDDPVTILHAGQIRARGTSTEIAGAQSLSDAFLDLTRDTAAAGG